MRLISENWIDKRKKRLFFKILIICEHVKKENSLTGMIQTNGVFIHFNTFQTLVAVELIRFMTLIKFHYFNLITFSSNCQKERDFTVDSESKAAHLKWILWILKMSSFGKLFNYIIFHMWIILINCANAYTHCTPYTLSVVQTNLSISEWCLSCFKLPDDEQWIGKSMKNLRHSVLEQLHLIQFTYSNIHPPSLDLCKK